MPHFVHFFRVFFFAVGLALVVVIAATLGLLVFRESAVVITLANSSISVREIFHRLNSR